MRLHLGREQALIVQNFQTIAMIVSQAFGGKKKKDVAVPKTKEELETSFKSIFG